MVYLLNYMLEVRRAGITSSSSTTGDSSSGGKKEPVIISLDEARLMFWLEVQVLFEMSAVMAPSRDDMSKVYDKFFRPGSGFYVHELANKRQQVERVRGVGMSRSSPHYYSVVFCLEMSMAMHPVLGGKPVPIYLHV